jgi:hypothetical protein
MEEIKANVEIEYLNYKIAYFQFPLPKERACPDFSGGWGEVSIHSLLCK